MPKQAKEGRRCKRPECGRLLSRYNEGNECRSHDADPAKEAMKRLFGIGRVSDGSHTPKRSTQTSKD